MADHAFTIRIFVPDGDPEGVRIIDRMNWTGKAIFFPREKWKDVCQRRDFENAGVYILVGYSEEAGGDDSTKDVPTVYIGEGDGIRNRIESHYVNKVFWTWGIAFISTNRGLNKAHAQWLEYKLVELAKSIGQCSLDNGNTPQEPALTEGEKADTAGFLREICQILPLVGLRAFNAPKAIATPKVHPEASSGSTILSATADRDTIVIPARVNSFNETFLGENCWYAIRIAGGMLDKIRWIAAYQTSPIAAITHVAPVHHIEPYGDEKKYKVVFSEPAKAITPVSLGDAALAIAGPRYTNYGELLKARKLTDLWEKP
jgi:hypothetical protein